MSNTALLLVATFLSGFGTYAIRSSFKTHLLTRTQTKTKKPVTFNPIITIKLIIGLIIAAIFERFVIDVVGVVPGLYAAIAVSTSITLAFIIVMRIITDRGGVNEKKVKRMLFLETGLLMVISYQILSPVFLTLYHFVTNVS